jgi:hypothetical protein
MNDAMNLSDVMRSVIGPVTVTITFNGGQAASFDCPACGKPVRFSKKHPFEWQHKQCKHCRLLWVNVDWSSQSDFRHVQDLQPGATSDVRVASSGRPV